MASYSKRQTLVKTQSTLVKTHPRPNTDTQKKHRYTGRNKTETHRNYFKRNGILFQTPDPSQNAIDPSQNAPSSKHRYTEKTQIHWQKQDRNAQKLFQTQWHPIPNARP